MKYFKYQNGIAIILQFLITLACGPGWYLERSGIKQNEGYKCRPVGKRMKNKWKCPEGCFKTKNRKKPYCTNGKMQEKWKPCRI